MALVATPLGIGIIGLGRSGFKIHLQGLKGHPLCRIVAVADREAERVNESIQLTGCRGYKDHRDLLADPEVEVVVVATPTHLHGPLAIEAVVAGKHVVVEKLMATSVAEADQMMEAARRHGRVLTVFHNGRLAGDFVEVKKVMESGRLGRIAMIKLGRYWFSRRRDWQTLKKYGGGVLNVHGAHVLDQALQLVPGAEVIMADLRQNIAAGDADDHAKLILRGPTGTLLDVEIYQDQALPAPTCLIKGEYGAAKVDGDTLTVKWFDPTGLQPLVVDEGPAAGRSYATGEVLQWQTEVIPLKGFHQTQEWYSLLYASLRQGAPLLVTPESARRLLQVIEEAWRLNRTPIRV